MTEVTYIDSSGQARTVELPSGMSLMQGAVVNGVPEIVGECGGNAMCATCHVYVDSETADALPPRSLVEDEMLEFTACQTTEKSRLSCQLVAGEELSKAVVHTPEEQL